MGFKVSGSPVITLDDTMFEKRGLTPSPPQTQEVMRMLVADFARETRRLDTDWKDPAACVNTVLRFHQRPAFQSLDTEEREMLDDIFAMMLRAMEGDFAS